MSKEEILEAIEIDSVGEAYYTKKEVHAAMDIHAKEVAIGFAEWKVREKYKWSEVEDKWIRWETREDRTTHIVKHSHEQLYQQYLNQRS